MHAHRQEPVPTGLGVAQEIFYVPQKPYTTTGTLREQLIYPLSLQQAVERLGERHTCLLRHVQPRDFNAWWYPDGNMPCCASLRGEGGVPADHSSRPCTATHTARGVSPIVPAGYAADEGNRCLAALDEQLVELMVVVRLGYLLEREGGWDAVQEWGEVLSLGESALELVGAFSK